MKKLLVALLALSIGNSQAFVVATVQKIVARLTQTNNLSEQESQELTNKLEKYKNEWLESCHSSFFWQNKLMRPANNSVVLAPSLLDLIAPDAADCPRYVKKNDPLLVEWLFEDIKHPLSPKDIARSLLKKNLVDPNVVDSEGVPFLHQVLFKKWDPEFIDLLLEKGADLEAHHPLSGDTPLLALPSMNMGFPDTKDFKKFDDKHRMRYLIAKGANIYAVNNIHQETLVTRIQDSAAVGFWNTQDSLDLHAFIIARHIGRHEGAQLTQLLPSTLEEYLPSVIVPTVGGYAHEHFGTILQEEETLEDFTQKLDAFFTKILPANELSDEPAEPKNDY